MSKLKKIITDTAVVESIAIVQEGGETDFAALMDIEMTSENLSYRNVLSEGTTLKSRHPFEEGDELVYKGDVYEDNFAVVAYTGTGATQDIITGIESYDINYDVSRTMTAGSGNNTEYAFDRATMKLWQYINVTPSSGATLAEGADFTEVSDDIEIDFKSSQIWVKKRSASGSHRVIDTLRGVAENLYTDSTVAEVNEPTLVTAFSTRGITLGTGALNTNAATYVVWQKSYSKIKVTTTNQFRRAIVAYDEEAGRSMTLYEGSGITGHEIPHGLGVAPELSVIKNLESVTQWPATAVGFSDGDYVQLSSTTAKVNSVLIFPTVPNASSVFTGTYVSSNESNSLHIMYSETSKADQIKISTYTGTGAAGNYVDCGFEPEYVMIRRVDSANWWLTIDSTRPDGYLLAHDSAVEASFNYTDFVGKGFTLNAGNAEINASGGTYLFIAYAKGSKTKKTLGTDTAAITGVTTTKTKNFAAKTYGGTGASNAIVTGIASEDFTGVNSSDYYFDRSTFEVKTTVGDIVTDTGDIQLNTSKVQFKGLSFSSHNHVTDGLRGTGNFIWANSTNAEASNVDSVLSFDASGVTLGVDATNSNVNVNTENFVVHQTLYTHIRWGITNHNKRYVEAYNPFTNENMVIYQGSGAAGHSIPHSLGVKLVVANVKNLDAAYNWYGRFGDVGLTQNTTSTSFGMDGEIDTNDLDIVLASTINYNELGSEHIMYGKAKSENWTIVEYTGTGAVDNYIETKDVFGNPKRPRRVIIKRTDSTSDWTVIDSERGTSGYRLWMNLTNAQNTASPVTAVTATGFELTSSNVSVNASGGEYIALIEFDTDGTVDDSYYDTYEGTHNASIAPTSFVNTSDTKLEWSLNDGATYHEAVVATRNEVDGVVTTTFNDVIDQTLGNRSIKHKVTNRRDGSSISRIRANIKKGE